MSFEPLEDAGLGVPRPEASNEEIPPEDFVTFTTGQKILLTLLGTAALAVLGKVAGFW